MDFKISFDPKDVLKDAEARMLATFRQRANSEVENFFGEKRHYEHGVVKVNPGVGLLMIQEFIEKKFDDPVVMEKMERYFAENFSRIMDEAMQKALQHKANAFVFGKAKDTKTEV